MFDFAKLKGMWLHIKTDVGSASYFSEIASLQTLDNLLNNGMIEFVEYLKRIPDELIPQKQELINSIEAKDMYKTALYNMMGQFIDTLPPEERANLMQLNPQQMEQKVLEMMGALENGSAGMGQVQDMEAADMSDPGYAEIMAPQTVVGRNDTEALNKVAEIGGLQS